MACRKGPFDFGFPANRTLPTQNGRTLTPMPRRRHPPPIELINIRHCAADAAAATSADRKRRTRRWSRSDRRMAPQPRESSTSSIRSLHSLHRTSSGCSEVAKANREIINISRHIQHLRSSVRPSRAHQKNPMGDDACRSFKTVLSLQREGNNDNEVHYKVGALLHSTPVI